MCYRYAILVFLKDFLNGKSGFNSFIKDKTDNMIVVQIYVDDILFGATNELLCKDFKKCMHSKFKTNTIWELIFFLKL